MRKFSLLFLLCFAVAALVAGPMPAIAQDGPLSDTPVRDPRTRLLDYGTLPDGRHIFSHGPDPLTEAFVPGADGTPFGTPAADSDLARPYPGYGRANALQCHAETEANLYETIYYAPVGYPQNVAPEYFRDNVIAISGRTAAEAFTENVAGLPAYVTQRFVTDDQCMPVVQVIRGTQSGTGFSAIVNDLSANFGKNRTDRKYLIYAEGYTSACGQGTVNSDQSKSPNNANNRGPDWSVINMSCSSGHTSLHEIGHNLGAVLHGSPYANGYYHCIDEADRMCYSEQGIPTIDVCLDREWWDCNHNDYFNPSPPAGSYLANYWNMATDSYWQDRVDVTRPWIDDLVVADESDYQLGDLKLALSGALKDNWATKSLFAGVTGRLDPIPNGCPASGYGSIVQGEYILNNTQTFQGEDFAWVLDLAAADNGCYQVEIRATDLAGLVTVITQNLALGIDVTAPVATITTDDQAILVGVPDAIETQGGITAVEGEVTDPGRGVDTVTARFTADAGPLAGEVYDVEANVSCIDSNQRNCTWWARAPFVPGIYVVTVQAKDRFGNFGFSDASIRVTVV